MIFRESLIIREYCFKAKVSLSTSVPKIVVCKSFLLFAMCADTNCSELGVWRAKNNCVCKAEESHGVSQSKGQ